MITETQPLWQPTTGLPIGHVHISVWPFGLVAAYQKPLEHHTDRARVCESMHEVNESIQYFHDVLEYMNRPRPVGGRWQPTSMVGQLRRMGEIE